LNINIFSGPNCASVHGMAIKTPTNPLNMNIGMLIIWLLFISLAAPLTSHALSSEEQLTKGDIQKADSWFSVKPARRTREGVNVIVYNVFVSPPNGTELTNVSGFLTVYHDGKMLVASSVAWEPRRSTEVDAAKRNKTVMFEFTVSSDCIKSSKFDITIMYPDGSGFSRYWFYLKDFDDSN
jgi:hypothetical protein